jgi:hypothetical protein
MEVPGSIAQRDHVAGWGQVRVNSTHAQRAVNVQYGACALNIFGWSIIDLPEVDNTYWSIIGGVR